ncbi:MAG: UDP-N-acetylglucosamine 4,6-dehydratase (inverting) [Gemmatimonadota bacterium]|nr:UDP-N-acetylglucosamine 4,6-dehydratase (inverting) [Gemmatimonadota bacterium]
MLNGKTVLITGGTGSFGQRFTEMVLREYSPKRLIVFSRDELKQSEMSLRFGEDEYPNIRYFIGDVRDRDRLYRAFDGVDIVVHAAALKQVLAAEYNPIEAVKTNVLGAANVIDAAIDRGVAKVIALSTDKAAGPVSLYGATKLCSDKLFVAANSYSGQHRTRFSVVRYGNVLGSRGSVIPFFQQQQKTGKLSITDPRMTRFWITLEQGVQFVLSCLDHMAGGEIFVPKIPSMKLIDLARVIGPDCEFEVVGRRPGEKLHELMVGEDDAHNTLEYDNYYAIHPTVRVWSKNEPPSTNGGRPCPEGFRYSSETNDQWLTVPELERMIDQIQPVSR